MRLVPLVSIADIQLGKMLSPKSKTGTAAFPYLRNQNVQWGKVDLFDLATMDFSEMERKKFELRAGDLLVCEGGEPGRCAIWAGQRTDCYYQKAIHRVRPHAGIADSEFLSLWIRHQTLIGVFRDQHAKTTIAHLPLGQIEQLLVPDISVGAQRRLAVQVREKLAAVDEAWQAALVQLADAKRLIPAILESAFAETGDAEWLAISDVARTTSGTTPSRSRKDYWQPPKHPWVKTGEVAFNPIERTEEAISERALAECSLSLLPPGTVLVAMYGQGKTRGQSAVLKVTATTNQACFAILPNERIDPEYLQFWLRRSYAPLRALSQARGGNQSNLNGEILNAFEIPLLSMDKQKAIAGQIKLALTEAEALQRSIEQQLSEIELLPSRLLAQAFDGNY